MRHGIVAAFAGGLLLMSPGMALAGHGKAGLWTVTSTTNMGLTLPPEVARQMKVTGAPGSRTTTSRMCMSQAEVDASAPPHIDQGAGEIRDRCTLTLRGRTHHKNPKTLCA